MQPPGQQHTDFFVHSLPSLRSLVFVAIVNRKQAGMFNVFYFLRVRKAGRQSGGEAQERCEGSRHFRGLHFFWLLGGHEREFREDEVRLHPFGSFAVM